MAVMDDDEVAEDLRFTTRVLIFDEELSSTQDGLADIQAKFYPVLHHCSMDSTLDTPKISFSYLTLSKCSSDI